MGIYVPLPKICMAKSSNKYNSKSKPFPKDAKAKKSKGNDRNKNSKPYLSKKKVKPLDTSASDGVRLNKYLARAGVASRREADELIALGLVEINGKINTQLGYKVQPTDVVKFDGRTLKAEKAVYVLLNKPKGFISTTKDEKARKTVMDLVANASPYRLFPVGRLDRATTGLILLTNDGDLTKKLLHPSHDVKKIYQVELDKPLEFEHLQEMKEKGVRLDEGVARFDEISYIPGQAKNIVGVELHIGWNRVIRRMFKRMGYTVEKLDRVQFAGLTKKNLPRGNWRILTEMEVNNLKML